MIQQEEPQLDQECDFIDVREDSEPDYGIITIDVEQINSVEVLSAERGKPRSLSFQLRSENTFFHATVDTGSPDSIFNKRTADLLMRKLQNAEFKDVLRHPLGITNVDYKKKPNKLFGSLEIPIASHGWKIEGARFLVPEKRTPNLWGLNLNEQLGIETVQQKPIEVNAMEEVEEMDSTSKFWRE